MTKYGKTGIFSIVVLLAANLSPILADEEIILLDGQWRFTTDAKNEGLWAKWFKRGFDRSGRQTVDVPHTWQVAKGTEHYYGVAWYARSIKLLVRA
jgi:beta-galactosidase/beta-glucuronidase